MRPGAKEREMKIKMAMLLKGVRLKDLAEAIGLSQPYTCQVIKGHEKSGKVTAQIMEYLGISE